MKVIRAILKFVIILVIAVPLGIWAISSMYSYAESMLYYPAFKDVSQEQIQQNANWMSAIDDNKLISEIALPGTHDSATQYVHIPYLAQCQSYSLGEQLQAGYRYLDIRLKANPDTKTMTFHHGPAACQKDRGLFAPSLDLNDGLDQCYNFLREHPTETIVFVVKQEDSKLPPSDFQDILAQYIQQNPDAWYINTALPTMEQARGKIVLMQRHKLDNEYKIQGPALLWEDQRQSEPVKGELPYAVVKQPGTPNVAVQDAFQYNEELKWTAFSESAVAMSEQLAVDMVKLNFLSTKGPTPVGHPFGYAYDLNKKFSATPINTAHTWTIVDFATPEIASKIISANFK